MTFTDDDGVERYAFVGIAADAPGVEILGDWDALGMRASGSHSVSFTGVEVPRGALRGSFVAGDSAGYMERMLTAGLFHASASLGIAEAAASAVGDGAGQAGRARRAVADAGRRERDRARRVPCFALARRDARGRRQRASS